MPSNYDIFLPANLNLTSKWPGLPPSTGARLSAIFNRAAARAGGASLADRTLFAACEFWSAVATGSLAWHLGYAPETRLRSMISIYAAIGAKRAARVMEVALRKIVRARSDRQRGQLIAALEETMLKACQSVDEVMARFAQRLLPRTSIEQKPRANVRWRTEKPSAWQHDQLGL